MCRQAEAASKILRVERPNIVDKNYRKISCTKSTVKQRQGPRVERPKIIQREKIGKIQSMRSKGKH